jgi:polysaccharide export outer membrane protein
MKNQSFVIAAVLLIGILFATGAEAQQATRLTQSGDQVLITAMDVEELNGRTFRIDERGLLELPLIGSLPARGQTSEHLQRGIVEKLRAYVRNPQVSVAITPAVSDLVFLVGALRGAGVYPLIREQRLSEVLLATGGLQPNASRRLKITRRLDQGSFGLPSAVENNAAGVATVEISLNRLMEFENPAEDIMVKPFDTINALRGDRMVYISGAVGKPGAYSLEDRDSVSVVQLLALAGGVTADAAPDKAGVLRPVLDTARRAEVSVDVARILSGKGIDFPLGPNDVLVIPRREGGAGRTFGRFAMYALPTLATSLAVTLLR